MLVVSVFSYVGLLLLGIPLPLSLAVLAGLLTFVPNIGPVLAAVPPILVYAVAFGGTVCVCTLSRHPGG